MKDAKGHGSNAGPRRPIPGHPYHAKTNDELRYIAKDAGEAARNMRGMNSNAEGKYLDQVNDAATVLHYRSQGGASDAPSDVLASGPKSAPAPVHDSMGRHGYSPEAVNNAIASSNRHGRRIGGKEAKMIHALLKGR
jgi:hypothetical protein